MAWVHPPAIGCRYSFLHLPCGRCGHSMNIHKNHLYIFGGYDGKRWLNDLHQFDTTSLVWSQPSLTGSVPQPRQYHGSALIDSEIFIFGGYNGSQWLQDLAIADLQCFKWKTGETKGLPPTAKEGLAMVSISKDIFVFGGWNKMANGDLHKLDTLSMEWTLIKTKGIQPQLCGHSMTVVRDNLYIFGGFDGKNWVNSLYIINPFTNPKWTCPALNNPPGVRGYHSAVLFNKHIIIYAGYNGKYILSDIVALDIDNLTWFLPETCSGHFPSARNAHTMALSGSQIYLFGGYNGIRDTNELHILETSAFSSLHEDFRNALESAPWKDVLIYNNYDSISVHSLMLKVRCPKMYSKVLKKHPDFLEKRRIVGLKAGNFSYASLKLFCEFIYCDLNKERLSDDVVDDLHSISIRQELPALQNICHKYKYEAVEGAPESSLAADLSKLKDDLSLSDYIVVVKGSIFRLHRLVLYARCAYFRALFDSGMKDAQHGSSNFDNIDVKAFEIIIDWMYSDKFSPLFNDKAFSIDLGRELLNATNFLHLENLKKITEITIWKLIDSDNAFKLLEIACLFNTEHLKSYCLNYVLRQFDRTTIKNEAVQLSLESQEELSKFLPGRGKRKNNLSMPSELYMVKYEKEDEPVNQDPVMVSGKVLKSLKVTKKEIIKNSVKSLDFAPSSQRETIIEKSAKLKPRVQLKINGIKAGGTVQVSDREKSKVIQRKPRSYKSLTHLAKIQKDFQKPEFFIKGFGSCRRGKSRMSSLVTYSLRTGFISTVIQEPVALDDSGKPFLFPIIKY